VGVAALFVALPPAEEVDGQAAARQQHQGPRPGGWLVQEISDAPELL
jgi:hypothetical protein